MISGPSGARHGQRVWGLGTSTLPTYLSPHLRTSTYNVHIHGTRIHMHVHIHIHAHIHAHTRTNTVIDMCTHLHTQMYTYKHARMKTYIRSFTHSFTHSLIHAFLHSFKNRLTPTSSDACGVSELEPSMVFEGFDVRPLLCAFGAVEGSKALSSALR